MLRARLFGRLAIDVDGRPVPPIAGLKPRAVCAWLLLHPGAHARARLAAQFWGDVLDTSARASLRNVLWTIRCTLDAAGGSAYLDADRDSVAIGTELPRRIDTEDFDRLTGLGDPAALERAFALAEEPLLADLADDWVLETRDGYRERVADLALRLADVHERDGDLRAALMWTRRGLARVPLRESVHRCLMQRLAAAGETAEALATYERCAAMLAAEFETAPSAPTRQLAERLRRGSVRVAPGTGTHPLPPAPAGRRPSRPELPLLGRETELGMLRGSWGRARQGHGGVALVSGAAGLGKSRLVTELTEYVEADQGNVAAGAAFELEGAPPFGPWAEVLRELVAETSVPPQDVAWPADLARLCRSVERRWKRPAAPPPTDREQERGWLFEAVTEALAWATRERPLLLVLEDVHLADRASIALLTHCGRRLPRLPVLLVATIRPAVARPELALAVDALVRRDALVARIGLDPLTAAQTAQLVRAAAPGLDAASRARVVAAAAGNPLLAREAARAAAEGSDLSDGLRAWVRAPLARLPGSARLLVDAVTLAARPVEQGEAADLVGAERLPAALQAACREELLDAGQRRIRFVHPLVREACAAELEPARRVWLHARLADVLDARADRSVAEIGRHLLLAGRSPEARSYLVSAAERARALGALDEAATFLTEAAHAAAGTPALEAELWLMAADAEAGRNRRESYDGAFGRAIARLEDSADWAGVAGAYVARGRCMATMLCYPPESTAAHRRALTVIDEHRLHTPELRALALAGLAWINAVSGDLTRARQLIDQVEALPEFADDPVLAAEVGLARAGALLRERRFVESQQASVAAAELAADAGQAVLAGTALLQAASTAVCRGALHEALTLTDRVGRCVAGTRLAADALADQAYALARSQRQEEAWAAVLEELTLAARAGADQEANAAFDAGSIALQLGRTAQAVEHLAAALAEPAGQFPRALARIRLAEARLRDGDVDGADTELDRLPFETIGPNDLPETFVPHAERLEGLIAATRGERDLALRRMASAEAGWRRMLHGRPQGDLPAAAIVDMTRSVVAGLVEPGLELGRVLAERAALLAAAGRAPEARNAAQEARSIAAQLGADGYRTAVEAPMVEV